MKSEWKEVRLGDICKTNASSYSNKENWKYINYLDTGNITQNKIDNIVHLNCETDKIPSRAKRKVKEGDIIYSNVRPNQFHYGLMKNIPSNFLVSTGFTTISVNEDLADNKFIYYYIIQESIIQKLQSIAEQSVSAYPSIKPSDLEELTIKIPVKVSEQKAISSILSALDDKIALNQQINNNLLEQSTLLFHKLFDKYENQKKSYISLGQLANFKYGTMPKKDKLGSGEYLAFSGYQIVGKYPEKMYDTHQLIIVARGVGGCGDIKYTPANCYLTNLAIAIITSDVMIDNYLFHYLRLHDTKVMNTGSAQPQITISMLEKYQLPLPTKEELKFFSNMVESYKEMFRKKTIENIQLSQLRDILLPKLISGDLDVSDIEIC